MLDYQSRQVDKETLPCRTTHMKWTPKSFFPITLNCFAIFMYKIALVLVLELLESFGNVCAHKMGLFNQPVFRHFLICVSCPKLQILIRFYAENDQSNFQALIFNRFWCIHVQKIPRYERTCWKYLMEYFDILAIIVYVITFLGKSSRSTTVIWHRITHLFYSKRGSACTSICQFIFL